MKRVRLDWALPFALALAIVGLLGPTLVLQDVVPARTDLPGHLLPPWIMAHDFLPSGQLRGWSLDWFAGVPLYYFYFPLPGVIAGLLGLAVGPALAVRLVTIVPLLLLPAVLHWLGGRLALDRAERALMVVVGSSFLLTSSFAIHGGNILSTLAGEYSYAWSLLLVLVYVGLLAGRSGPKALAAGVVLAAAILSHILPVLAVAGGCIPFLASRRFRRPLLASGGTAFALTAFWLIPLAARIGEVGHRAWVFEAGLSDFLPAEVLLLLPAALLGLPRLRSAPGIAILGTSALFGLVAAVLPQTLIMQGRLLPIWYLFVHILAGVGLGRMAGALRRHAIRPGSALVVAGGLLMFVLVTRGVTPVADFRDGVLGGLPARPGAAELEALVEELNRQPADRVYWENGDRTDRWGGPHVFGLIPLWTPHTVLGGLLGESSPRTDFLRPVDANLSPGLVGHPEQARSNAVWDPSSGVERLRAMGVRYFIAFTIETTEAIAEEDAVRTVGQFGELTLFDLGAVSLVEPLGCRLAPASASYRDDAIRWWEGWHEGDPWLVASEAASELSSPCPGAPAEVEGLTVERERIRFRNAAVGVPHLIRVSSFPNWQAVGARGPYLTGPWFMMVIPEQAEVVLEFRTTWVERLGWLVTLVGILTVLIAARRSTRSAPRSRSRGLKGPTS